uniref:ABC transporter domain-containing protein n=1 Tax=Plectus sambesii TaxID=2011161 RepID=A0A914WNR3_9BILA
MAVIGFLSFGITLLLEFRRYRKVHSKMEGRGGTVEASVDVLLRNDDQDSDVRREIQRVHNSSRSESDIVRLEHLTKVYKSRKQGAQLAVDHLCIGVPNGECFGLLGVNGAGKTTTFRMLTGDLRPTRGDAFIASKSVQTDLANAQRRLGYCPQFDALFDELTAREHLTLYAKLRGVPPETVGEVVDWLLTRLDLMSYADKVSSTFSGGTKRKLSTAQALIGNPDLILLDEPTTGMDPRSRRFLWDVILGLTNAGKSIILTSHSMEECEVLCTRLAIMVNGRLRCLGSTQHLKNKYGDGYSLRLRLKADATNATKDAVCEYIQKHFCDATLKELHYGYMHYEVTSSVPLSRIFAAAERCMRDDLPIESYSISQNTLDNVFVGFVKFQGELAAADELERKAVSASQNRPFLHDDSVELTRLRRPGSESDIAAVYEGPRFDFNEDDDDN